MEFKGIRQSKDMKRQKMLYFSMGSGSRGETDLHISDNRTGFDGEVLSEIAGETKTCVDTGKPCAFRDYTVLFHVLHYFFHKIGKTICSA